MTRRFALFSFAFAVLAAATAGLLTSPTALDQMPVAAAHYNVRIVNFAYSPASISVNTGDTITWTNEDTAPHTVTTSSGPQSLNSPNLSKGQSWSFTFTKAGTYSYYCAVHPDMRAAVVAKAAPAAVVTTAKTQITHHPATTKTSHTAGTMPSAPTATGMTAHATHTPASQSSSSAAAAAAASSSTNADSGAGTATSQIQTLSPALLLGGLTAAIAVFCLLLVASRSARTEDPPE
jgi:amicyanin